MATRNYSKISNNAIIKWSAAIDHEQRLLMREWRKIDSRRRKFGLITENTAAERRAQLAQRDKDLSTIMSELEEQVTYREWKKEWKVKKLFDGY